jgi:nucleotide-binding universal stress UspA family protein
MKKIITRIVVPTDFSDTSDTALDYARALAARFGASLHLLHVLDDPSLAEGLAAEAHLADASSIRTSMLEDARSRLRRRMEGCTTIEAVFGGGATTIVEYADRCGIDLIVMGTHGRTGLAHLLLGSVAERVVRSAPCPVLTVGHGAAPARDRDAEAREAAQPA